MELINYYNHEYQRNEAFGNSRMQRWLNEVNFTEEQLKEIIIDLGTTLYCMDCRSYEYRLSYEERIEHLRAIAEGRLHRKWKIPFVYSDEEMQKGMVIAK